MAVVPHLGHGSGNGEKSLLLQQTLVHRGHIGFDMELICLPLGTLRFSQAEVMVGPPVMRYASIASKSAKNERTGQQHTGGKCELSSEGCRFK